MAWKKLIYSGSAAQLTTVTADDYNGIIKNIGITVDGGGSEIVNGIKSDIIITDRVTITEWYIMTDAVGTVQFDLWVANSSSFPPTIADSITPSNPPLASGVDFSSGDTTGWTTNDLSPNDIIRFTIDNVSTITKCTLILKCITT